MANNQQPKSKEVYSDRAQNAINVAQAKAKERQAKIAIVSSTMKQNNAQGIQKALDPKKYKAIQNKKNK
jgi:hypothetical protein